MKVNMSPPYSVSTRFHQQDGTFYCGAACAEMVLGAIGAGIIAQDSLMSVIASNNKIEPGFSWVAAPDALQYVLNANRPAAFPCSIELHAVTSKDTLSRKAVWSIYKYQLPAVVLISGMSHWIVVYGFQADAVPTSSGDTAYNISSLDIHNPNSVPGAPPPPHDAKDLCGTGGLRGLADENVSYSFWLSTYLYPVPAGSYWEGKFITIADSDPPAKSAGKEPRPAILADGERILSPDESRIAALAGIKQFGLDQRDEWVASLRDTKPGTPILVQRLDQNDTYYYVVPLQTGKSVPILVSVDGRFGNYLQAARTAKPRGHAFANLNFDPLWAEAQLLGRKIDLGRKGRLTVRKEALALYPTLIWKPCRESMSPYVPFFMATVGNRQVYLRVDGQLFTRLHDRDRGN